MLALAFAQAALEFFGLSESEAQVGAWILLVGGPILVVVSADLRPYEQYLPGTREAYAIWKEKNDEWATEWRDRRAQLETDRDDRAKRRQIGLEYRSEEWTAINWDELERYRAEVVRLNSEFLERRRNLDTSLIERWPKWNPHAENHNLSNAKSLDEVLHWSSYWPWT